MICKQILYSDLSSAKEIISVVSSESKKQGYLPHYVQIKVSRLPPQIGHCMEGQ